MKKRCTCKTAHNYKDYGGRGIKFDLRWTWFRNFLFDMGERPIGKTLDRREPEGNYCKENCRWSANKAFNRRNTNWFVVNGKRVPLAIAARMLGVKSNNSLYQRLAQGWSKEAIVKHYGG